MPTTKPTPAGMTIQPNHPDRITADTTFAEVYEAMAYLVALEGEDLDKEETAWVNGFRHLAQDFYMGSNRNRLALQVQWLEASQGEQELWQKGYAAAYGDDEHCKETGNWTWREWRKNMVEPWLARVDKAIAGWRETDEELEQVKKQAGDLLVALTETQRAAAQEKAELEQKVARAEELLAQTQESRTNWVNTAQEQEQRADALEAEVARLTAENGQLALAVLKARGEV